MAKKTYTTVPSDYAICMYADCKMAATCLHRLAYPVISEQQAILSLINPNHCSKDEKCKYYRECKDTIIRG